MQTRRLLLIDRDPDFAALLRDNLASYGFDIREISDEDDPLSRLHEISPELIVIAVELPDKVGYSLCNKAKKGGARDIPVVLATRSLPPSGFQSHRKLRVHADGYLDKRSLTSEELLAAVDGLVGLGESSPFDDDLGIEIEDVVIEGDDDDDDYGADFLAVDDGGEFGPESTTVAPPAAFLHSLSNEADAAFDALGFGDEGEAAVADASVASPADSDAVELDVDDLIDEEPELDVEVEAPQMLAAPSTDENTDVADAVDVQPVVELEDVHTAVDDEPSTVELSQGDAASAGETLHDVELASSDLTDHGAVVTVDDDGGDASDASDGIVSEMVHDRVATSSDEDDLDFGLDDVAALAAAEPAPETATADVGPELSTLREENRRLRSELDAARNDFSRDREVLNLNEIVNKKDRELLGLKEQLDGKSRELLTARERLHEVEAARAKLDETRAKLEANEQELQAKIASLTESAEQALADQATKLEEARETALAELRAEHDRALEAARAEATTQQRAAVETAEAAAAKAVEAEKAAQAEALAAAARDHEQAMQGLVDQHAGQLARLEREAAEAAEAHARSHGEAVDRERQASQEALAALRAELEAAGAEALASAEAAHAAALATATEDRAASERELGEKHAADRAALEEEHGRALAAAHAERDELAAKLAARDEAFAATERELGLARETITEREGEIEAHKQSAARQKDRIASLEREVADLEGQNAGYQEQVLEAYQRIKSDEATTARAKKALAIALTLLDEASGGETEAPSAGAPGVRGDEGDDASASPRSDLSTT